MSAQLVQTLVWLAIAVFVGGLGAVVAAWLLFR